MSLKLIIADLVPILPQEANLPSLQYLLNRSISETIISEENLFCHWFGVDSPDLPIAAISGLGEGIATQADYWLRADPVQLQADLSAAYLLGNQHLTLQTDEVKKIIDDINALIVADNLHLTAANSKHWYLRSKINPNVKTFSLQQIINNDIAPYLPTGANATYWRRLFTEIQMLLHAHPINQQRQAHGLPTVNGLWFWGAGQLPVLKIGAWQKIWCYDDPLLKGLSCLVKCPAEPLPETFAKISAEFKQPGDYVLQLSAKPFANKWTDLEKNWLQPIWQALRNRQFDKVTIYIGTNRIFTVTANSSRYFWKKRRPLTYYLDYEKKNNTSSINSTIA